MPGLPNRPLLSPNCNRPARYGAHLGGQVQPVHRARRVSCHRRVSQGMAEARVHDDSAAQVQPAAAVAAESAGAEGAATGAPWAWPLAFVAAPHPACAQLRSVMP